MVLPSRPLVLAFCAALLPLAGCGSGDGQDVAAPPQPPADARPQAFPAAAGKTLGELQAGLSEGPVFAPTVSLLEPGVNRIGFALFDVARKQLTGAPVALYLARPDGSDLRGPFVARTESLAVKPQFRSRTTAQDPESTTSVYVADVPVNRAGKVVVVAVARMGGKLVSTGPHSLDVGAADGPGPPRAGEKAVRIHTLTLASVGGDASKISTRVPPAEDLLRTDFADVVGRKPAVLIFATPQLCVSRVCGPVVDVAEQVKDGVGDDVAFIHQEIYNENDVAKGFRPQVRAWRLPTEPWFFVVDRRGRVSARFEGAVSVGELQRAVAKVALPAR